MRRLTNILVIILFVFCFSVTALGCTRGDIMDFVPAREALTNNVVVHDPSIFYDEVTNKYYAFGCSQGCIQICHLLSSLQQGALPSTAQACLRI